MNTIDARYTDHAWAGQEIIVDTAAHPGFFSGLVVVAEAVVSAMTWSEDYDVNTGVDWSDLTALPPGYYPGKFSSITLASGEAIAIRRMPIS